MKYFYIPILLFSALNGFSQYITGAQVRKRDDSLSRVINTSEPALKQYITGVQTRARIDSLTRAFHKAEFEQKVGQLINDEKVRRINDSISTVEWMQAKKQRITDSIAEAKARKFQIQRNKMLKAENDEKQKRDEEHSDMLVNKYGWDIANKMAHHKVEIHWTKEMCIESLGKPYSKNRTITATGTWEQWVYGYTCYLYFDGDILVEIQDNN